MPIATYPQSKLLGTYGSCNVGNKQKCFKVVRISIVYELYIMVVLRRRPNIKPMLHASSFG